MYYLRSFVSDMIKIRVLMELQRIDALNFWIVLNLI